MTDIAGPTKEQLLADALRAGMMQNGSDIMSLPRPVDVVGVRKVRPRHKMAVMLAEAGWTNNEIAKALGYKPARVSIILNSRNPELQKVREETASRVADNIQDTYLRIRMYANEMLGIMVQHARDQSNPVNSRHAARDILHMAGYAPIKRQFNVDVQVPGQEIVRAAKQIEQANEVALRAQEWTVRVPTPGESSDDDQKG